MQRVSVKQFLALRTEGVPLLDVRSPGEFASGHILGATSFPLFDDETRAAVGTIYVQEGRDPAVVRGLEYVGPRMATMVREATALAGEEKRIAVYCFRGGMRSASVAWLLDLAGFSVVLLEGGYKAYHREMLALPVSEAFSLRILGGPTGCGKGAVLQALAQKGVQVIDLELLANHRGSVFGGIGQMPQPSGEQFINLLGEAFLPFDPTKAIWLEGESFMIGHVALPHDFHQKMLAAPYYEYHLARTLRLDRIEAEYGSLQRERLLGAFGVIAKRLGKERYDEAIAALERGDIRHAASLAMAYYDKSYPNGRKGSWLHPVMLIEEGEDNPAAIATRLLFEE